MKVIGITGTNGAGKGTVVEILQKTYELVHLSARSLIIEIAQKEGISLKNRDDLREYNEQRNRNGKSLIGDVFEMYNTLENKDVVFIFESIRRVSEIRELRGLLGEDFILLGVDAPIKIRYDRIKDRASMSDGVSFEEFLEQERLESVSMDENQKS